MRVMFLIAAVAAAMLFDLRASQAYYQAPWCAVQSLGSGSVTENCSMLTFEQCRMETIAGNRGYCIPNRWSSAYGLAEPPRRTHKRRVRHH